MSVRYEWMHVNWATARYVPEGHDVSTGELADEETPFEQLVDVGTGALVISADEATVLVGTPDQLRAFLERALAALPGNPSGPPYTVDGCEHCAGCGESTWECICEQADEQTDNYGSDPDRNGWSPSS